MFIFFFFQAEDGIRDKLVTGVQTCALPICSRLLPAARIAVIDRSRANLDRARPLLSGKIEFVHAHFMPVGNIVCDLLVVPLSFQGNRDAIYARPPATAVIMHDWIWRKRGESRVVSIWLLKRLNLLRR